MYCHHCGAKQSEDAVFCVSCGKKLIKNKQPQPVTNQEELDETSQTSPEPSSIFIEEGTETALLRSYIGEKKTDYYLSKWASDRMSWNWPAFFFGLFWLGYRKMYGMILVIIGIFLFIDGIDFYFGLDIGSNPGLGAAIGAVLGIQGNQLYKEHAKRQIKNIKQETGEIAPVIIKAKGGSSWGGFWISIVMLLGYGLLSTLIFPM